VATVAGVKMASKGGLLYAAGIIAYIGWYQVPGC